MVVYDLMYVYKTERETGGERQEMCDETARSLNTDTDNLLFLVTSVLSSGGSRNKYLGGLAPHHLGG